MAKEDPSHINPDYELWETEDMMAMSYDEQDLLYGWVRATKPELVVEVGTYRGTTARRIGEALQKNSRGKLITIEISPEHHGQAANSCINLPVECILADANTLIGAYENIGLLLIDGDHTRYEEVELWLPYVADGGFIFIHDALKGDKQLYETAKLSQHHVVLFTPRGMAIIQKALQSRYASTKDSSGSTEWL